jgi:hypothetical protein
MSDGPTFDANRRLAEIALWTDAGARWVGQAILHGQPDRHDQVTVTFRRAELEAFVTGLRGVAQSLLGFAQPVPPPVPTTRPDGRPRLRLVRA